MNEEYEENRTVLVLLVLLVCTVQPGSTLKQSGYLSPASRSYRRGELRELRAQLHYCARIYGTVAVLKNEFLASVWLYQMDTTHRSREDLKLLSIALY